MQEHITVLLMKGLFNKILNSKRIIMQTKVAVCFKVKEEEDIVNLVAAPKTKVRSPQNK